MTLQKIFLLPILLAVGCTVAQPATSDKNNTRIPMIMERSNTTSDTAVNDLKQSKIDRSRLQITPVRIKNMNPDSIPRP